MLSRAQSPSRWWRNIHTSESEGSLFSAGPTLSLPRSRHWPHFLWNRVLVSTTALRFFGVPLPKAKLWEIISLLISTSVPPLAPRLHPAGLCSHALICPRWLCPFCSTLTSNSSPRSPGLSASCPWPFSSPSEMLPLPLGSPGQVTGEAVFVLFHSSSTFKPHSQNIII